MTQQVADPKAKELHSNWLYRVSAVAALIVGGFLSAALIELTVTVHQPAITSGWPSLLQDNWLILIFKLHAGFDGVRSDVLHGLNLLDVVILALVGAMCFGLYAALRDTSKIWISIASALPFIGLILFSVTKIAGRSSVMGAALIISLVMLRNNIFNKVTAYVGILASVLLLAGDFSVGIPHSTMIAALFGIGYVLLTAWFFLVGRRLSQFGK